MSRRAINEQRAKDHPEWRNPTHNPVSPMVARTADEVSEESLRLLRDEVANLRRDNETLREENARLRAGAPARAPTQDEVLNAIASAIQAHGAVPPAATSGPVVKEPRVKAQRRRA